MCPNSNKSNQNKTKNLGKSETTEKFTSFDCRVYENEKYHSNNINKNLIEINRIRARKYESPTSYKITGHSQTHFSYPNHFNNPDLFKKLNSNELPNKNKPEKSHYYNEKFVLGKTEYFERYQKPTNVTHEKAPLKINPSIDLTHGSYGRPYEKVANSNQTNPQYDTQYKLSHQWPAPDNLKQRFEWLN